MRAIASSVFLSLCLFACSGGDARSPAVPSAASSHRAPADRAAPSAPAPLVVFLGDSLTAGLGLEVEEAYPARVAEALDAQGVPARVLNAGVSGDTTAGGLARLDWLLAQRPALVVVALGANDGLRGQPLESIDQNLRAIVTRVRAAGARVVLAGMQMPPNYGPEYTRGFRELYPRIARELDVPLIPFLLDGVAAVPQLNQPDGIHPTAEGQRRIAGIVLPVVERELAAHGIAQR